MRLVSEASKLYEAGNYAKRCRYYDAAAARPEGAQLRVFNGLYLANTQLGRTDDAEKAFAKIVALGLATNSLSVKFLYRPGSLEFLADPKISGPYTMWLRLIAREVAGLQGLPYDRRSHEPNGNGAIQRQTLAAKGGGDAAAHRRPGPGDRGADAGDRNGVPGKTS
jgi:hypothetical protein